MRALKKMCILATLSLLFVVSGGTEGLMAVKIPYDVIYIVGPIQAKAF